MARNQPISEAVQTTVDHYLLALEMGLYAAAQEYAGELGFIAEDAEDSAGALSEQLKDSEEYIKDLQRGCDH